MWRYVLLEYVQLKSVWIKKTKGLNLILVYKNKNTCLHMQILLWDHDVSIGKICPRRYGVSSCTKQWTHRLDLSFSFFLRNVSYQQITLSPFLSSHSV